MSNHNDASGPSTRIASPSSRPSNPPDTPTRPNSHLRNEIASPASPGSDVGSSVNDTSFAPSLLASRLGRSLSGAAVGSTTSLTGSGFNSPSLALTGFNAISTVLNNPSKRQHPIDPKSSRYPPVTPNHVLAEIPKVKKSDLDGYLSSVRPEWDRFMRNQSIGRQGKATLAEQQEQQQQQSSSYDSESFGKASKRHRTTPSLASLSADLNAVPSPAARKRLPPLSAVPQVFFSEDFDLGNPYTFDLVTERYKATAAKNENADVATPTYDVALNQMLQEKLSYYSDVIEQHLIIEIGQQSSSFFAALDNLNDLNAEAESCLSKISHLKSELQDIDHKQAKKGLGVIREQQRRRQLHNKQGAIQTVRQALERRELIRLLVQQGETEEALEMISSLRTALQGGHSAALANGTQLEPTAQEQTDESFSADGSDPVRLSELRCLSDILPQLDEMEASLSGLLEQDLIAILTEDIASRLREFEASSLPTKTDASQQSSTHDYFKSTPNGNHTAMSLLSPGASSHLDTPTTPSKPPASPFGHSARPLPAKDADLSCRIAPLVIGLARTGGIEHAVASYRELAVKTIKDTWKSASAQKHSDMSTTVEWLLSEDLSKYDDPENLPGPAAYLRDMQHSSFLDLGRTLFDSLLECLKAIDAQCKLIPRILDEYHRSSEATTVHESAEPATGQFDASLPLPPTMPEGVPTNLPNRMSEIVVASAEQAHSLCARILTLRSSTHTVMDLPPFLMVFQLCWGFILSSELICRKMIVGMRGPILGQAKGFLAAFHRKRIERAAKAVEEETWAQAEVGQDIQHRIKKIVESAVEDPAEFVITAGGDAGTLGDGAVTKEAEDEGGEELTKTLEIEDRQYFVVNASLDVLGLLVEYLKVIINLPLLTTEAMARVVEFLKQFNSRTCQVVLGAGAMRSAGLKNITAKHLALASQSLSIMISLIPYIRETVRRHLSPKQAVMLTEFDKLRRDFQEHQYEIHAKLVAIMSDRLTVHCRSLNSIDWNAELAGKAEADSKEDQATPSGPVEADPNKYAVDLVKETATLHKVLSKYLQVPVVEHVIGQVLRAIDTRIAQELEKVEVRNQNARDRLEADIKYLGSKLSALKNVEWKGDALQNILDIKQLPPPPLPASAPSTPVLEQGPGTPNTDKGSSQFAGVSYKPRIPNIFARRQQQQQASPRGSTDLASTSTPNESRKSVEGTPRTSLQQARASEDHGSQPPLPQKDEKPGSTAKSIEEEVEEVPPTPPSKVEDMESTARDPAEEGVRGSEDIIAPVVPAPAEVIEALVEGTANGTLAEENATDKSDADACAPSQSQQESEAAHVAPVLEEQKDLESRPAEHAQSPNADTPTVTQAQRDSISTVEESKKSVSASDGRASAEMKPVVRPSTPVRNSNENVRQDVVGKAGQAEPSSPAGSGTSTPATPTSTSKPGRMSLKERLAEAARKRAMQSAPSAASATVAATAVPSTTATEATKAPVAAPVDEEKKGHESGKPDTGSALEPETEPSEQKGDAKVESPNGFSKPQEDPSTSETLVPQDKAPSTKSAAIDAVEVVQESSATETSAAAEPTTVAMKEAETVDAKASEEVVVSSSTDNTSKAPATSEAAATNSAKEATEEDHLEEGIVSTDTAASSDGLSSTAVAEADAEKNGEEKDNDNEGEDDAEQANGDAAGVKSGNSTAALANDSAGKKKKKNKKKKKK